MEKNNNVLLILFWGGLIITSQMYTLIPISEQSPTLLVNFNKMNTLYLFIYAIGGFFWGMASDKYGRKSILTIGLSGMMISTFLLTFLNENAFFIVRLLQGFFCASFASSALAIASRFNKGVSIINLSFLLSAPLLYLLLNILHISPHYLMLFFSLQYMLLIYLVNVTLKSKEDIEDNHPDTNGNLNFIISGLGGAFSIMLSYICYQLIITHSNQVEHNLINMLTVITLVFSFFFIRKIKNEHAIYMGYGLLLLSFLLVSIDNQPCLYFSALTIALGVSFLCSGISSIISISTNTKRKAYVFSMYSFILFVGSSVGSYIYNHSSGLGDLIKYVLIINLFSIVWFILWRKVGTINHRIMKV